MEDKLVSLETAKLAKKKEFNEICQYYYEILDKPITLQRMSCSNAEGYKQPTAPTQSLLAKWLRERYNIYINIIYCSWGQFSYSLYDTKLMEEIVWFSGEENNFDTYEEALEFGLRNALKLIK